MDPKEESGINKRHGYIWYKEVQAMETVSNSIKEPTPETCSNCKDNFGREFEKFRKEQDEKGGKELLIPYVKKRSSPRAAK